MNSGKEKNADLEIHSPDKKEKLMMRDAALLEREDLEDIQII